MKSIRLSGILLLLPALILVFGFSACAAPASEAAAGLPFDADDLYAVAYLGYGEMEDLSPYAQFWPETELPTYYNLSEGEYYLILPRYPDSRISLYQRDMMTAEQTAIFADAEAQPFLIHCNVSDIFPDADIVIEHRDEIVVFSPYLSLKDGSLCIGERGLDITAASPVSAESP